VGPGEPRAAGGEGAVTMKVVAAAVALFLVAAPLHAQTSEVKGWHGAEWGMTPDQVAVALDHPLVETKRPGEYVVGRFELTTTILADVTVRFDGAGLSLVMLQIKSTDYQAVRDEVKAHYGDPTSEAQQATAGLAATKIATWLLPSTQVQATRFERFGEKPIVGVNYSRHVASGF
jgi:hypothetical protein